MQNQESFKACHNRKNFLGNQHALCSVVAIQNHLEVPLTIHKRYRNRVVLENLINVLTNPRAILRVKIKFLVCMKIFHQLPSPHYGKKCFSAVKNVQSFSAFSSLIEVHRWSIEWIQQAWDRKMAKMENQWLYSARGAEMRPEITFLSIPAENEWIWRSLW